MLEKIVTVGDKDVKFKSSAAVPRIYRVKFGRDIFVDIDKLEKSFAESAEHSEASDLSIADLTIFENVAYIMAYHADPTIPDNIDDWLEQFEMFSIYDIFPQIIELWGKNQLSQTESKKNTQPRNAK